jgi:hypothetical protein
LRRDRDESGCNVYRASTRRGTGPQRSSWVSSLKPPRSSDPSHLSSLSARPLHGIPILIQDSAATLDKMETTAGSTVLLGARPPQEARLVRKLRLAGAVILGKTNMEEWGGFRMAIGNHGWSARGGVYSAPLGPICKRSGAVAVPPLQLPSGFLLRVLVSRYGCSSFLRLFFFPPPSSLFFFILPPNPR